MSLEALADKLRAGRGIAHKRDIDSTAKAIARFLGAHEGTHIPIGDDCAAIPDSGGYLLFAIEGFLNDFVEHDPWFAGYCSVMVNASDVYSMGGRPIAVVDALWSDGSAMADRIVEGLVAASTVYGIPIVGGHTNTRNKHGQLAAAILGRAQNILSSFEAKENEILIAAIDLRGSYREPYPNWDASTSAPPERLRDDLEILPSIAEAGLSVSAKDISMGGVIGTALMLLECSGIGAVLDVNAVPRPECAPLERWLQTFPSYGFILSVSEENVQAVLRQFTDRGIAAAAIGRTNASSALRLSDGDSEMDFWDLRETPLIGFTKPASSEATL